MLWVQLAWIFFSIRYDKWKTLFFIRDYGYSEIYINRHVIVFFETSALKKVRLFSPLFSQ